MFFRGQLAPKSGKNCAAACALVHGHLGDHGSESGISGRVAKVVNEVFVTLLVTTPRAPSMPSLHSDTLLLVPLRQRIP